EAVGVRRRRPGGRVAAVRAAANADARLVDAPLRNQRVDAGQDVAELFAHQVAMIAALELFVTADAAAIVRHENEVAVARQELRPRACRRVPTVAVTRLGTSVHDDDERIALAVDEAERFDEQPFEPEPIVRSPLEDRLGAELDVIEIWIRGGETAQPRLLAPSVAPQHFPRH